MKRNRRIGGYHTSLITALVVLLSSCDSGFDTLNIDDSRLTSLEPVLQLNRAVINSAANLDMLQCETSIVKQHVRIFTGVGACGNFNVDVRATSSNNWNNGYQARLRELVDALASTEEDSDEVNLHNMARIWTAYTFMRITDSYGDVPYTQGGTGSLDGVVFPEYDSQELIYTSSNGILEELANAADALDPTLPGPSRDVLYGGDVSRWKRLGYSLLLRAAMRLSKRDPDLAREYVARAVSGGLMESSDDNAVIWHTAEFVNQPGSSLNGGQAHFNYLVADFVDYLQDNDDPRLAAIAVRYPSATSNAGQTESDAERSPAEQIGMPMGFDNNDIGPVAEAAGLPSFFAYSQIDRTRMMDPQAPSFLVTYAQTQLLLAEAVHRGWQEGNASALYEEGIRAHMEQISTSYSGTAIAPGDIEAYIQDHPLEGGQELNQINTQYWVASFLVADESWANFRRSGYPELTPNPRQDDLGPDESFMRRFGYPDAERSVNPNVENGVTPDRIDTRIWWDVKDSE